MDHADPVLRVVHEDERLLAVEKPSGRLSVGPADASGESVHTEASRYAGQDLFGVHRLDRGTSGLLLFARDVETQRRLSRHFETRQVEKTYLALVLGHVDPVRGEIALPIRAFGSGRMGTDERGKPSLTRYELNERLPTNDLLTVRPMSGRRHQVRVHLHAIGHPVLGDRDYGEPRPVGGAARLMLHALELTLPGPDGTPLSLRAEPPDDFLAVLRDQRA